MASDLGEAPSGPSGMPDTSEGMREGAPRGAVGRLSSLRASAPLFAQEGEGPYRAAPPQTRITAPQWTAGVSQQRADCGEGGSWNALPGSQRNAGGFEPTEQNEFEWWPTQLDMELQQLTTPASPVGSQRVTSHRAGFPRGGARELDDPHGAADGRDPSRPTGGRMRDGRPVFQAASGGAGPHDHSGTFPAWSFQPSRVGGETFTHQITTAGAVAGPHVPDTVPSRPWRHERRATGAPHAPRGPERRHAATLAPVERAPPSPQSSGLLLESPALYAGPQFPPASSADSEKRTGSPSLKGPE
uniref:Uncharacterized protein n=1 Tax=Neospora caninum (strain Liverpool) TaxID=572307 RepID=A0A0F7UAK5_NEOCL|nr:TPA: hypothetical protein BN1204_015193 [Neospora caninum Liverpool]